MQMDTFEMFGENFLLMHDNAPHKVGCVSDFLNVEGKRTMGWPACSPDINLIEHVWDMLGRRLRSITTAVQNPERVAAALVEIWDNLPQDMIDNVIRSMKRRLLKEFWKCLCPTGSYILGVLNLYLHTYYSLINCCCDFFEKLTFKHSPVYYKSQITKQNHS